MSTLYAKIQKKHRTALEFTNLNEVLLLAEEGFETDTLKEKIGDGVTPWNSLPYKATGTGGGIPTEIQAGTTVIKTDKQYISTGANAITQTGSLSFTGDLTGAIINGGGYTDVNSNASAWLFDGNFGEIATGLTLIDNQIIPDNGVTYRLIFYWNGSKIDISIIELQTVNFIPQLNAPIITSVSTGMNPQELDVTLTDTNTSPNESGLDVYYRVTSVGGAWTLGTTTLPDVTAVTINTGVDDTECDVSSIAKGSPGLVNDSERSNILTGSTPSVVTPLFEDNFDGTVIDTSKWTVISNDNTIITQNNELIFTSPASGSGDNGNMNTSGKFDYDVTGVTTVLRIDATANNLNPAPPRWFVALVRTSGVSAGPWIGADKGTSTNLRMGHGTADGGGSYTATSVDLNGSFKVVLESGAVNFYKWNGTNWGSSLHTGTYNDENHSLRFTIGEIGGSYVSGNLRNIDLVKLYNQDFATLNP